MGAVVSHNPPTGEGQGGSGERVIESARTGDTRGQTVPFLSAAVEHIQFHSPGGGERVYRQDSCG